MKAESRATSPRVHAVRPRHRFRSLTTAASGARQPVRPARRIQLAVTHVPRVCSALAAGTSARTRARAPSSDRSRDLRESPHRISYSRTTCAMADMPAPAAPATADRHGPSAPAAVSAASAHAGPPLDFTFLSLSSLKGARCARLSRRRAARGAPARARERDHATSAPGSHTIARRRRPRSAVNVARWRLSRTTDVSGDPADLGRLLWRAGLGLRVARSGRLSRSSTGATRSNKYAAIHVTAAQTATKI